MFIYILNYFQLYVIIKNNKQDIIYLFNERRVKPMNLNETIRLIEFAKDNGDTIDDVLDLLKQIAGTDGDDEEVDE